MLKNGSKKGFLLVKMDFAFLPTTFIVYWILVHYRVGSLEIDIHECGAFFLVHYRVGSLETAIFLTGCGTVVHYRVGSLEIHRLLSRLKW